MLTQASLSLLNSAFLWSCRQRRAAPSDADIWHLRWHWPRLRTELSASLSMGGYRLRPMLLTGRGRKRQVMWEAQDAVVLKWVALQLKVVLPVHPLCEHHQGHGGGRLSVQRMHHSLRTRQWGYVCRTDIRGFYGHIRRVPLMQALRRYVKDPLLLNLVNQYLHYSVEDGGEFYTPAKGICRGCALSPLLAGFCLWSMDTYFEAQRDIRYVRYMDDIVILARTRWRLRRAVRSLNVFFASGGYEQHPDKTFIGRTDRGFDWMGIQFTGTGATGVAPRALANHRERCRRLYEQAAWRGRTWLRQRLSAYVKRWTIWKESNLCNTAFIARSRQGGAPVCETDGVTQQSG
ncbi:MAG: reverse transcriptase domain-containing protein [Enterobacter ludwigii]|nr:reverse transcriptase domain-containing protein [Enterobacter ludwigii]